jgi:hypothetical protein
VLPSIKQLPLAPAGEQPAAWQRISKAFAAIGTASAMQTAVQPSGGPRVTTPAGDVSLAPLDLDASASSGALIHEANVV